MTAAPARPCTGTTATGTACENTTTHPTRWCGQCARPPAALAAYAPTDAAAVAAAGPGPDPLNPTAGGAPLRRSEVQADLVHKLTGNESIVALAPGWADRIVGCDDCACLFMVDDRLYLDRFALNPDGRGHCSGNPDCACHDLPKLLPEELYEACEPSTAPGRLEALAAGDDLLVLRAIAANPSTPPETLTSLAVPFPGNPTMGDKDIQRAAATNPNTPPGALTALAGDRRTSPAVAANPKIPEPAAVAIIEDPTASDAHRILAANPAAPPAVLAQIASNPAMAEQTRVIAAANPSAPRSARFAAGLLND